MQITVQNACGLAKACGAAWLKTEAGGAAAVQHRVVADTIVARSHLRQEDHFSTSVRDLCVSARLDIPPSIDGMLVIRPRPRAFGERRLMRRMRIVRFVLRLARVLDLRSMTAADTAPIDPALLPIDLALRPMAFN